MWPCGLISLSLLPFSRLATQKNIPFQKKSHSSSSPEHHTYNHELSHFPLLSNKDILSLPLHSRTTTPLLISFFSSSSQKPRPPHQNPILSFSISSFSYFLLLHFILISSPHQNLFLLHFSSSPRFSFHLTKISSSPRFSFLTKIYLTKIPSSHQFHKFQRGSPSIKNFITINFG
ncbi:hypothetical protein RchiOBHm_Chr2g0123121 [Rosa chinensis]|uniref:Uncharacterized protein n=1 Tax=Rosa chinensis TaxID=74649 RepID=A0A2P6RSX9_ROSCH|nr:hypothetical protein RchiOBHm_Chr2g0123121 [Rosa chinensis]